MFDAYFIALDHSAYERFPIEYDDADRLLKRAQWNVKVAIVMQKTGLSYLKAL